MEPTAEELQEQYGVATLEELDDDDQFEYVTAESDDEEENEDEEYSELDFDSDNDMEDVFASVFVGMEDEPCREDLEESRICPRGSRSGTDTYYNW